MTRLVFVTQRIDPNDPVLGITLDLIESLAERCERLVVVANEVIDAPFKGGHVEVVSLNKELGWGRVRRGIRYEQVIGRVARTLRPDALLAHMCPIYLNLAAPVVKAYGIKSMLWFAYPRVSPTLIAAEYLSDCILTALPGSYPRQNSKVHAIGHAIDVSAFRFVSSRATNGRLRLLSIARTAPEKHHDTTLLAVASLMNRHDITLRIFGSANTPAEHRHRSQLRQMIIDLGIGSIATLEDPVPRSEIPGLIAESDCLVSAAFAGGADKAVLEAMAVGRPTIVSNVAFEPLLRGLSPSLQFRQEDPADLARRIEAIAVSGEAVRREVGRELSARIDRQHSVSHWADCVVRLARQRITKVRGSGPE